MWTKLGNMSTIVFMSVLFCLCLYNHCFICLLLLCFVLSGSCQRLLNTPSFIQRTQQVLIELDNSAIEEYAIFINVCMQPECRKYVGDHLWYIMSSVL